MSVTREPSAGQPMSWEQYTELPEDPRVEFLDGRLLVSPSPSRVHQNAARRLAAALEPVLPEDLRVTTAWSWRTASAEFIPDVMVHAHTAETTRFTGTPQLVVEVLSGNRGDDLVLKSARYAAAGLPHYWVLDPRDRVLDTYVLHDGLFTPGARVACDHPAEVGFGPAAVRVDVAALLAD